MGDDPLDIPPFLKRDANNKVEWMNMSEVVESEEKPVKEKPAKAKSKANGKVKAVAKAAKPVVKAKPKAKVAKGPEKTKATKPKAASKSEKDQFGLRKGSAKSLAAALYARKSGATLEEVKEAVGSIQLNVLNDLEANGFLVEREKEEREGQRAITRYWLRMKK